MDEEELIKTFTILKIQPKQEKEPNLVLIKAIKDAGNHLKIEKPLIVYNEDGTYTDEILKIYNKKTD
jgi:tRNA1Val (adenine37-N6)-methyltransferase